MRSFDDTAEKAKLFAQKKPTNLNLPSGRKGEYLWITWEAVFPLISKATKAEQKIQNNCSQTTKISSALAGRKPADADSLMDIALRMF